MEHSDSKVRAVLDHLVNQGGDVSKVFFLLLSDFCMRNDILFKKNFTATLETWLLVVQEYPMGGILRACLEEPIAEHLGYSGMLARV